jgi:hypothetical protein
MASSTNELNFSFFKRRNYSYKHTRSLNNLSDPFAVLSDFGNKLKPVSPKFKFPKSNSGLPPHPKQKPNPTRIQFKENTQRIPTPNFKSNTSQAQINMKKLR